MRRMTVGRSQQSQATTLFWGINSCFRIPLPPFSHQLSTASSTFHIVFHIAFIITNLPTTSINPRMAYTEQDFFGTAIHGIIPEGWMDGR